ncbi:MAG TPA: hypothetical protein VG675_15235 [Bryobacteraceae bacterium]|nr:hypothetical protein [Bryobacteraceae bacterium]
MQADRVSQLRRRDFLKHAGLATSFGITGIASGAGSQVAILIDPSDAVAASRPGKWAASELASTLQTRSVSAAVVDSAAAADSASLVVVAAGARSAMARDLLRGTAAPAGAEAFALKPAALRSKPAVLACASDARGLVYALLELADRARYEPDVVSVLKTASAANEHPANELRSNSRAFVTEVEDKAWYYDKDFWRAYLTTLATNRFNRFNFALGMGYDFPRGVTGDYFHFPYPYLVDVPGYHVRVVPLSAAERERNMEMLRFITDETAARGIEFQLGIWTHAYAWTDSPHSDHHVEGLDAKSHPNYCRDALHMVLQNCPAITGVTFRVHGESGIPEGSYDFWATVFQGIARSGRRIEIDMHAKGIDDKIINVALATGMPVKISPKYWAEHMGLGYHQAAIRELEMPPRGGASNSFFALSEGARKFMRYGYGDLYKKDRKYGILYRMWPGTQRVLLWGDPAMAAAYGRTAHFCGASGVELCEPLFFKGRKGSGLPGGRTAYADESLQPKFDFEKYLYSYRLWGRMLYSPKADPESWRRYLRTEFGQAAAPVETALANCSRVLPTITTTHLVSASNNSYWPEIYTSMPIIVGKTTPVLFHDTPEPRRFGTVSPLDPELFSTIEEHAGDLLKSQANRKYSPIEVAAWLERFTGTSAQAIRAAGAQAKAAHSAPFRRLAADVDIQNGLGQFFAAKFRAGVLYAIYQQSGDRAALEQALAHYKKARAAFQQLADRAKPVYRADITYGPVADQRGHWLDRLPAIDADVAAMEAELAHPAQPQPAMAAPAKKAVQAAIGMPHRPSVKCSHTPAASFRPNEPLKIELAVMTTGKEKPSAVELHYRRVDESERWQSADMEWNGKSYETSIRGEYTNSAYPLQYYFELRRDEDSAWMFPGFAPDLSNQPYFAVRQA